MTDMVNTQKFPNLPTTQDAMLAKEAAQSLSSLIDGDTEVEISVNRGEAHIDAKIPASALQMMIELLSLMSQGKTVTFVPTGATLTTKQAANLLNVSRPFLIGLLDKGEIDYHMVGTHRKVKFEDLRVYMEERDNKQKKTLDELSKVSQAAAKVMGEGY